MRLSPKALAFTFGLLWGAAILLVGSVNVVLGDYGDDFLEMLADVYPGFEEEGGFGNVLIGTVWGSVDGLVGGWLVAVVYNLFAARDS